jgi:HPt (histidine-containing phosphotransfer) domain-containing protein
MDEGDKYAELTARLRELGLTEEPAMLAETTQLFLNDAAHMVEAMKTAYAKGGTVALGRAAHRLKGAALNLGAVQVAAPARTIEEGSRRGELLAVADSLQSIETELTAVGGFLRELAKTSVKV